MSCELTLCLVRFSLVYGHPSGYVANHVFTDRSLEKYVEFMLILC